MNPWLEIWTNPRETIDKIKDSNWVNGWGLFPYFFLGINGAIESDFNSLFGFDSGLQWQIISITIVFGIFGGGFVRFVWVNLIYFFGKIWKGQASRRNIDSVFSLSFIPQVFIFIYLIGSAIVTGSLSNLQPNGIMVALCSVLTFVILLIGLSRVQRFSYGFALLNIFIPQLVLIVVILSLRALYY